MKTPTQRARFAALRPAVELATCSDAELWSLLTHADEVSLLAGDRVMEEGRYCSELVIVMEGKLRARSRLVGPGDMCGWNAMWERSTNPVAVTAETDARVLVMSHDQFRAVKALVGPGVVGTVEPCLRSPSLEREARSSLAS